MSTKPAPVSGTAIAATARKHINTAYKPGVVAQCANFVRYILAAHRIPIATAVTAHPDDGYSTGLALASSLCGKDLGALSRDLFAIRAGDLVFFNDTYDVGPDFGPNTITHIGIAVDGSSMMHRPTSDRLVELAYFAGHWSNKYRCHVTPSQQMRTPVTVAGGTATPSPGPASTATVTATDPEPARSEWKVYMGGGVDIDGNKMKSFLIDKALVDADGRLTITAQTVAELTGHRLIVNTPARAVRFEPIEVEGDGK